MRKPVFYDCYQVRLKPAYSATDTSYNTEILHMASLTIILNRKGKKTLVLIRQRGAGWYKPLLFPMQQNQSFS